ncbi:MAG TPA: hypothetical protein PKD99_02325 [Sphingopyxis sp.]|nr:hypothetical protein [Sphingopyxis sp.]HMP43913.1 hypothetical protein [Sphingopyxis sp.]HMQ18080.1 hypothetical protein [Sphingopyxis sp.]
MSLSDAVRDGAGFTGCALVSYGAWAIYPPAGFIVAGLILAALSVFGAKG